MRQPSSVGLSAQHRRVKEDGAAIVGDCIGLKHDQLILSHIEPGSRNIEGFLRSGVGIKASEVVAVQHGKAMLEAVKTEEGVGGVVDGDGEAVESGGIGRGIGGDILPVQPGDFLRLHAQRLTLPAEVKLLAEADAGNQALFVAEPGSVVDAAHVFDQQGQFV